MSKEGFTSSGYAGLIIWVVAIGLMLTGVGIPIAGLLVLVAFGFFLGDSGNKDGRKTADLSKNSPTKDDEAFLRLVASYRGDLGAVAEHKALSLDDLLSELKSNSWQNRQTQKVVLAYSEELYTTFFPGKKPGKKKSQLKITDSSISAKHAKDGINKSKVYWFENGEPMFLSKPWLREFLIELDIKYKGNLEKKCKDGGEPLSDVMAFIESDPQLHRAVKVIILKYSESRYEKYFGLIKSKPHDQKKITIKRKDLNSISGVNKQMKDVEGISSAEESFQGDNGIRLLNDLLNMSPILKETKEGLVNINPQNWRNYQRENRKPKLIILQIIEVVFEGLVDGGTEIVFRNIDTGVRAFMPKAQSKQSKSIIAGFRSGDGGSLKLFVPATEYRDDEESIPNNMIKWEFNPF